MSEPVIVTRDCKRCGDEFSYEKKKGRPRELCDSCAENHAPRNWSGDYEPQNDFHVHLSDSDSEKLGFIMENYGTGRIDAIRTAVRVTHAILLRDMSRR